MRTRRISISSSRAALAATAVGLLAAGDGVPPPADVRPAVALIIAVEGPQLEPRLGAACGPLRQALGDSLLALLGRNFSFLQWQSAGAVDTLTARWQQRASLPRDAEIVLTMRGAGVSDRGGIDTLDFEEWGKLVQRPPCPSVLGEWTAHLDTNIQSKRDRLVEIVFGQVPLALGSPRSRIRFFTAPDLMVEIRLRPDEIRATGKAPTFRLDVQVDDPGPPASQGDGVLELTGCLVKTKYSCEMTGFTYRGKTTTAEARRAVLERATLTPQRLHLVTYEPATFVTGANGTMGRP